MKTSLPVALRHTRKQAERTHDKGTANQRKELAVALTKEYSEGRQDEPVELEPHEETAAADRVREEHNFKAGDFVALVEQNSTFNAP